MIFVPPEDMNKQLYRDIMWSFACKFEEYLKKSTAKDKYILQDLIPQARESFNGNIHLYLKNKLGFQLEDKFTWNYFPIGSCIKISDYKNQKVIAGSENTHIKTLHTWDEVVKAYQYIYIKQTPIVELWMPEINEQVSVRSLDYRTRDGKSKYIANGSFRGYWIPELNDPIEDQMVKFDISTSSGRYNAIEPQHKIRKYF